MCYVNLLIAGYIISHLTYELLYDIYIYINGELKKSLMNCVDY
jgi:hypothetical protein